MRSSDQGHAMAPTTYGFAHRRRELPGVTLIESIYEPNMEIGTHAHELPISVFVVRGMVTTRSASGTLRWGPDTVRTVPAGERHSNTYGADGACCFLVAIKPEFQVQVGPYGELLERPLQADLPGVAVLFRRMYEEFALDDDAGALAIQGCLYELVALLARLEAPRQPPGWLSRVRSLLEDRFRGSLTIREVGEMAQVHPVHLARQFRRYFGCSPSDYVRSLRVAHARRALRTTGEALTAIAAGSGFADQSHFTREFRRVTGMTPAAYRARARH